MRTQKLGVGFLLIIIACCWPKDVEVSTAAFIDTPQIPSIYERYQRALNMEQLLQNKIFRDRVIPYWSEDGQRFWYKIQTGSNSWEYIVVDASTGKRTLAFDHKKVAYLLSKELNQTISSENLPIDALEFQKEGLVIKIGTKAWLLTDQGLITIATNLQTVGVKELRRLEVSRETGSETWINFVNNSDRSVELLWVNPEGQLISYGSIESKTTRKQHTYAGHVWIVRASDGVWLGIYQASKEGGTAVIPASIRPSQQHVLDKINLKASMRDKGPLIIQNNNIYLISPDDQQMALTTDGASQDSYSAPIYYSPNMSYAVVFKIQSGQQRKIYLIESSPQDQLNPRLHEVPYPKPGDILPIPRPVLIDIKNRLVIPINPALMINPYELRFIEWSPDSKRFYLLYNQRGHQIVRLIAIDVPTGSVQIIVEERSQTFVDYAHKLFYRLLHASKQLIWMSERDGWNHLYLFDLENGALKTQITKGEWVVRRVLHIDEQRGLIWFLASGIVPGQDPYFVHLCKVNFDGSNFKLLTSANGTHEIEFSPNRKYFIARWSRVDHPPVTELRDAEDGKLICELERADWSPLLATGWLPPEPFVAKGRDGITDIYGVIYRPSWFNPNFKYPILEEIYAGPQGAYVPKAFSLQVRQHALAELGFIVVQIDGMGTSYRSKKFHDVCWRNLGDAGLPDRILWIKTAASCYPYMDLERVGVYGGSAGGQNALRALLIAGDFYKVGVADCGCHDNRMDKIWWNELWMGWPIGPHYEAQSNVTHAHRLKGKLLLIVGELDRNVDPASTLQVVNALIKADKDFEMLVLPGVGHGAAETPYASRKRMDFLVKHLLGEQPPSREQLPTPMKR